MDMYVYSSDIAMITKSRAAAKNLGEVKKVCLCIAMINDNVCLTTYIFINAIVLVLFLV